MLEVFLIALALAVDATVYSFSYGLVLRVHRVSASLWLALSVGLFQAVMPLIGYAGGEAVRGLVETWAPWIVCAVFLLLGGSVILQTLRGGDATPSRASESPLRPWALVLVGIATSIDALAIGVCMALGGIGGGCPGFCGLLLDVAVIGAVTFVCSLAAFHATRVFRHLPTRVLECAAGVLLMALGVWQVWG